MFPGLEEEARRVALHYQELSDAAQQAANSFWSDAVNADTVVMLPDRLCQGGELVKMAKAAMMELWAALWPRE